METNDNVKFALAVLDIVNKKKEEIKVLTSQIIELEGDPKNIVKIKQNVQSILNAVAFCSNSNNNDLELVKLSAKTVFDEMRMCSGRNDQLVMPRSWGVLITHRLEEFCTYANAWNPIEFDFKKKSWKIEFKNLNIGGIIQNK
jgi:hypothetical protein